MGRLIDADLLMEAYLNDKKSGAVSMVKLIEEAPTAEKHAHWEWDDELSANICSSCGRPTYDSHDESDLISREKLKDDIAVLLERNDKLIDEWLANCIDDVIDEQPTVDAEPVKHGHWYDEPNYLGTAMTMYFCSECGSASYRQDPYCWHCGAKMEVEE